MRNEERGTRRGASCRRPIEIVAFFIMAASVQTATSAQEKGKDIHAELKAIVAKVTPAFVFIGGGSGVLVSSDGYVVTNHHVAGEKPTWKVRLTGGKTYVAETVGFDPRGDITLLKIKDGKDLPFVEWGDSDALKPGERLFAVGNPFLLGNENWEPTVTFGIVSALHRFQEGYSDAVQTDAQINPGNSGGPLFTMEGKLIGINGRIAVRFFNRVNTGVGYAIPSNQIRRFLEPMKKGGRVLHGYVAGLTIADADYAGEHAYGDGTLIMGVESGSPAEKAGFEPGDLVKEIAGFPIFNAKRFHGVVGTYPAGATVKMKIARTGADGTKAEKTIDVPLGAAKSEETPKPEESRPPEEE